ncbi:MAG: arginyltransferase [Alphaproteobacteria bacterium]|nr:arginyltransferase [Alphaproteobacteria bacterium]
MFPAPAGRAAGESRQPTVLFHITPLQACPYLPERMERKLWTDLSAVPGATAGETFRRLSVQGFRRSHRVAYKPACPSCNACVPVRVRADRFAWTRTLRRVRRDNAALSVVERPPVATAEQYALFSRYLDARHHDGEMSGMAYDDYKHMVEDAPRDSGVLELQAPDGSLRAACLVDHVGGTGAGGSSGGLSAVYSFYDPDIPRLSLGTMVILALIERAQALALPFVYLGYWIDGSEKMAYKARFRPLEGLIDGRWQGIEPSSG